MTADPILTRDDLPTLRRLAAHYTERARHRGWQGRIVCHALAKILTDVIGGIERHGVVRPEVNYRVRREKR